MKRHIIKIGLINIIPLLLLSCLKEENRMDSTLVTGPDITAKPGAETKTVLSVNDNGEGTISWRPQETINVFFNKTGLSYTSTNVETAGTAIFKTVEQVTISDLERDNVWGLYPYDTTAECDGSGVLTRIPAEQKAVAGTFDTNLFPLLAHSSTTDLSFYNVCGGIKFSLSRDDVFKVVLRSTAGENLAGKVKLTMPGGRPAAEVLEGETSITLVPKTGAAFKKDQDYYIACLPVTMSLGFQMDFYTVTGKKGTLDRETPLTVKRAVFSKKEHIDEGVQEWGDNPEMTGGKRSGLYLGITGFNQQQYIYPITRLNEVTITDFRSFVNGLPMKNGTLLCYAVDQSIDRLKEAVFPDDLCAVALVTFTDGLDQGSIMMNPSYGSDENYLNAIQSRIQNERISNHPITAYSVGLKGSDVSDEVKFRSNLQKLASTSGNAYEVSNMSGVNTQLQAIAKKVTSISYLYDLSITIPGQSDGSRIRITFDNARDAENSYLYIEGTFRLSDYSLYDVTYHGLSSASGSVIRGSVDGIFVSFSFEKVRIDTGVAMDKGAIAQWGYIPSTGKWQINSEFNASQNTDIEVTKQSVAVMLVLDCSSSLDSQFSTMRSHANSFIKSLQEASYDPYAVSSVKLNYTSKSLAIGETLQLTVTVGPNTARNKSVLWTTSDPSVAMVDQDGVVTALAAGTATITVMTIDGGYKATCEVESRYVSATNISLNKTSIVLTEGATEVLTATKTPSNASDRIEWSTSDASVVTVDEDGNVTAIAAGLATITVNCGEKEAECSVTVISTEAKMDLGLSVKWASCNLCEEGFVNSPEQYGAYYAWGELDPKNDYSWSTYKWCSGSSNSLTKYNTKSSYGAVDNRTVLESGSEGDDAASKILGEKWRIPTQAELQELIDNCTVTWTKVNGVNGRLLTSKKAGYTDKSIFLPAAGDRNGTGLSDAGSSGGYWSSSLRTDLPYTARSVLFYSDDVYWFSGYRYYGFSVRPVFGVAPVESISLTPVSLSLYEGETAVLTPEVNPSEAAERGVTWSSDNTDVATVDQNGKVTAVLKGSATITATCGSKSATCVVTVKRLVSSITLNKTSFAIYVGKTETLTATVSPTTANNTSVTWTSSDPSVTTVSSSGLVTGKSAGNATITVTANDDSGVEATCDVEVRQYVTGITLSQSSIVLSEGQTQTLTATIKPDNASDKKVIWTSSNYSVASVAQNGKVTARSKGEATITATANDGSGKIATCAVTVKRLVSSITLNKTSFAIYTGKTETLTATVTPSTANNSSVTWTSSNPSVATVSSSGLVTGKTVGNANITVTANDESGVTATCKVEVMQYVTDITLSQSLIVLIEGQTQTLTATIKPDNASDKKVVWTSSHDSVASVDQNGTVTARSKGDATITATANDGSGILAKCSIIARGSCPTGAVDLGLSVHWASCNLGENGFVGSPEEYGAYYAWGETATKSNYSWSTYKWCNGSFSTLTKYNTSSSYGTADNKTQLELSDDVARQKLGGSWRMPTIEEFQELIGNCTTTWTKRNGVKGRLFTSKKAGFTDKSIFLPAAGRRYDTYLGNAGSYGDYWSSSLYSDSPYYAWDVYFYSDNVLRSSGYRYYGHSVRPVSE